MKSAHDVNSLKASNEVILNEAKNINDLESKLSDLGKMNSASKEVVKKYLEELVAMEGEIGRASDHFRKVVTTVLLSQDDRVTYAFTPAILTGALARFTVVAGLMEK